MSNRTDAKALITATIKTNGRQSITGANAQTAINGALDKAFDECDLKVDAVSGKSLSTNDYDNTEKAAVAAATSHIANTSNPHSVTKSQVGLGNVDNTSDANKPISTATQTALDAKATTTALNTHIADTTNPHSVTKSQVGLGNCDNTADADKPVSTATQALVYPIEADVDSLIDDEVAEIDFPTLPLMCGQPMILFGNGTPAEATVPDNWKQFAAGGYNWTGLPSALGQQYIDYSVNTGGRYIAVNDGAYALKWLNF